MLALQSLASAAPSSAASTDFRPNLDPRLLSLKDAAIDSLAGIFARQDADIRDKRLAAAIVLRYVAAVESRDRAAPTPAPTKPPLIPDDLRLSISPPNPPPPSPSTAASRDAMPISRPNPAPIAAPQFPFDSQNPAARLHARAGASLQLPNPPHVGINFHPTILSTPRAPPSTPPPFSATSAPLR